MELTGHVEILSGQYVAFGQNFEIQQGSIDFSTPQKINPSIEIFAEKETGNYTVELVVNGNLERLMQDLQIRDANGNYLTNLSLYDKLKYISGSGEAGLVNTGEDVINTSVETVLERGAQDLTGLDKVQINDSKGVVDLQSMKLNNGLQDASISIGKYLTNNLYLEYRSQFGAGAIPAPKLSWEPGNQISLAYKINKFLSVESAYAQTLRGNTLINISLAWKTTF
jgi:translocation and assembly module TamB